MTGEMFGQVVSIRRITPGRRQRAAVGRRGPNQGELKDADL